MVWADPARRAAFEAWLAPLVASHQLLPATLRPASADASFRRYLRIDTAQGASCIVMDAPPDKENCRPFVQVQALMAEAGLNVPQILAWDEAGGFMLLTDLGKQTLIELLQPENPQAALQWYLQATDVLLDWQKASRPGVLPAYDEPLLRRELSLFPDWYLARHRGVTLTDKQQATLDNAFNLIVAHNLAAPSVFVHRDFMTRNLMAPTLGTGVSSLPPEGALAALGRPGGGSAAPTLGTGVSSLPPEGVLAALGRAGGGSGRPFRDFDHFLASLSQDKRKKIRQERRRVDDAGVRFRWAHGSDITPADWDFFYDCYERTYLEHGNAPYLSRDFFQRMQDKLPQAWVLFIAEREGRPIASSLIAVSADPVCAGGPKDPKTQAPVAYGRYWGALERVDCLHFEACYYQPLQWCIAHGVQRFEGGAQGEHKMARALLPVQASSAHWLAHPAFANAVESFLQREGAGVSHYLEHLQSRSPFRQA